MSKTKNPVVYFEIGCSNQKSTQQFYENCFEWSFSENEDMVTIDTGTKDGINGHITSAVTEIPNHLIFYVEVDDPLRVLAKIESQGGSTVVPPIKLPNGKTFAWFRDIAGNTVGLITK